MWTVRTNEVTEPLARRKNAAPAIIKSSSEVRSDNTSPTGFVDVEQGLRSSLENNEKASKTSQTPPDLNKPLPKIRITVDRTYNWDNNAGTLAASVRREDRLRRA
jgi:hypothetical protein